MTGEIEWNWDGQPVPIPNTPTQILVTAQLCDPDLLLYRVHITDNEGGWSATVHADDLAETIGVYVDGLMS